MFTEIAKKLMVGALAGVLLLGASNAMAEVLYKVVLLQTASGTIDQTKEFCMPQLIDLEAQGFEYVDQVQLEPRLVAYYLRKPATRREPADAATLLYIANPYKPGSVG